MDEPTGNGVASRRGFLLALGAAALVPFGASPGSQADSLAGRGDVGTLRDPTVLGRPRVPTDARENDKQIQAIETRLACNCGCTLDVFTCRTTDFTCTYSPALHREVLALFDDGKTAQEILDAFVAKYGEKALMAPKPRGVMNLTGYLLPTVAISIAGGVLFAVISRRRLAPAQVLAPGGNTDMAQPSASPEELERLRRALADVED